MGSSPSSRTYQFVSLTEHILKSVITERGKNERLVEVEVSEKELEPHFETLYRKYQKNVRLEGFRKGKVPLHLIKKLYGDVIRSEAVEEVVQSVFHDVSEQENLRPVSPAKLEDINYQPGSGLAFKAVVEVFPEFELKQYHKLAIEKEVYQISDEDINRALEDVREQMAVMNPVEGPAEENHYILANFQQIDISGVPIIGKKFDDRFFQLNGKEGNQEITDQLIGVKAGETRRIELPILDEADPKDKKTEIYSIQIKEIKDKEFPQLDDELAKDVGDFQTIEDLKADIEKKLLKQSQANSRRQFRNRLIDELLKRNSFELPESMINNYVEAFVENAKKQSNGDLDEKALKVEFRPNAIWNLKWELVKEKLIELEDITATNEDKDIFTVRFAAERGIDEKKLRASLKTKRVKSRFENDILEAKVLDFLEEHAKIKERKVTRKDIEKTKSLLQR